MVFSSAEPSGADPEPSEAGDRRRERGERSRRAITRHAVDVASVEGLSGLTIGRLAADLGMSKGGVATLFRGKEQLQLATVATAREVFLDAVVRPAAAELSGAARLRALTERWLSYAGQPLFPGGCFWAAALPDFDSRPGPVRDALRHQRDAWLALLADEARRAPGSAGAADPRFAAFRIDAVLTAANTAMRLGEPGAADAVRRVVGELLTGAGAPPGR